MSLFSACSGLVRIVKHLEGTRDHRELDRRFWSVVQWCSPDEREIALHAVHQAARISPVLADNARYATIDKYGWRVY